MDNFSFVEKSFELEISLISHKSNRGVSLLVKKKIKGKQNMLSRSIGAHSKPFRRREKIALCNNLYTSFQ